MSIEFLENDSTFIIFLFFRACPTLSCICKIFLEKFEEYFYFHFFLFHYNFYLKTFYMNCQITSNKEYDWMPIMVASECFASEQNTKTVATLSSSYVSQTSPTSYFGYYGQVWPLPSKMIMPTCRKLMFICMQKMNSIPNFFSEILQIHVFFQRQLHFWGYRQGCLANFRFQG